MEKNQARIGPMIVGVDRAASVQSVNYWRRNFALFNKVGTRYRPIGIVPHRVECRQFLQGFLLGILGLLPTLRKRKRCLTCCKWKKIIGQASARCGNIDLGKMDNQINCTAPAYSCFVIEPPAARNDDVVMLVLRTERRTFRPNLKSVMLQHIAERNAANLVGKLRDFHL